MVSCVPLIISWPIICKIIGKNDIKSTVYYPIKAIRLDNVVQFTSQDFDDYCLSMGIKVKHRVAHIHTQNDLGEWFIKHLQLIARPQLMKTKLFTTIWGHATLHTSSLVRLIQTHYNKYSLSQLIFGHEPNVAHLRIFNCVVYVSVTPPQRIKMAPREY